MLWRQLPEGTYYLLLFLMVQKAFQIVLVCLTYKAEYRKMKLTL